MTTVTVDPTTETKPETQLIAISALQRFQAQDRKWYSDKNLDDLVTSFRQRIEDGDIPNIEPLHVVPDDQDQFIIHAGERRHRAAEIVGYDGEMLCLVHNISADRPSELMFLSNHGRENLTNIDLAEAIDVRIKLGIWDKKRAMRMTNIEEAKFFTLRSLINAPQPVKDISRHGHRQGIHFLARLSKIDEPALSCLCDKIKNGTFRERELLQAERAQKAEQEGLDPELLPKLRLPTKMSLSAETLRRLCDKNGHLRKIVKDVCRARYNHSRLAELKDGEFIQVLSIAIDDFIDSSG